MSGRPPFSSLLSGLLFKLMTEAKKDAADLKGKTGAKRLFNAFFYSCDGFRSAWKSEQAFRQEALLALILIPAALLLPVSLTQSALLIFSLLMLLIAEVLNSAVEAAIDRIGPELHPLSKKAKDLGSLAVLIALAGVFIVWALVLADAFL